MYVLILYIFNFCIKLLSHSKYYNNKLRLDDWALPLLNLYTVCICDYWYFSLLLLQNMLAHNNTLKIVFITSFIILALPLLYWTLWLIWSWSISGLRLCLLDCWFWMCLNNFSSPLPENKILKSKIYVLYIIKTDIEQCWFYIFPVQLITLSIHRPISFSNGFMGWSWKDMSLEKFYIFTPPTVRNVLRI